MFGDDVVNNYDVFALSRTNEVALGSTAFVSLHWTIVWTNTCQLTTDRITGGRGNQQSNLENWV